MSFTATRARPMTQFSALCLYGSQHDSLRFIWECFSQYRERRERCSYFARDAALFVDFPKLLHPVLRNSKFFREGQ
jgi:hypothetical protein